MRISEFFASVSVVCLLGGCFGAAVDDPEAGPPEAPQDEGGEIDPPASEPGPNEQEADRTHRAQLIRGNVSGTFPTNPGECEPLGVPITLFLADVFGLDTLVDETATPISDTLCLHEQVLAAPADAWARYAYGVVCSGGGDARLCGAQATRLCSVDLLLQWAEDRTEPVASSDPIFGFNYVMPPLDKASRNALYRRTLQEVQTLLAESEAVLSDGMAGTRNCPDEDCQEITARYVESFGLYQRISERLTGE